MRTEGACIGTAVFLLPHQDDEFGVFEAIHQELADRRCVEVWYLTTGVRRGGSPARRNAESLLVLARLGVDGGHVRFVGEELGIADGELAASMDGVATCLAARLSGLEVTSIFVPAWEGGHPDHDSLHAVAAVICAELGLLDRLWQFHLYNGFRRPGPLFRVLSPLAANGPRRRAVIPWRRRVRYLLSCLSYPSQWRSWLGLFPFAALHLIAQGVQELQPVSLERIRERPHAGPLYYEKRRFSTWEDLSASVSSFTAARARIAPSA